MFNLNFIYIKKMIVSTVLTIIIIVYLIYRIFPKKRIITTGNLSIVFMCLSLLIGKNLSDVKKDQYNDINDKIIKQLYIFDNDKKEFTNINDFKKDFWISLTNGNYYEYHKAITIPLILILNNEYKKIFIFICKNILKLPWIIYKIYNDSLSKEEIISKLIITDVLSKSYQIALIMKIDLNIIIKRVRLVRNIPIIDRETGLKMLTRQVKFPMVGSEVCPFMSYVNKCNVFNTKLKYSIIIVEKKLLLEINQYRCDKHESCVLYKNKYDEINHLEECEFWKDDKYWERKYPNEREFVN